MKKRIFSVILLIIISYFLFHVFRKNWHQITSHDWTINWLYLSISVALLVVYFIYMAILWRYVLLSIGTRISKIHAIQFYFLTNLSAYVPGRVLTFVSIAHFGKQINIPVVHSITTAGLVQVYSVISGVALTFFYFVFPQKEDASFLTGTQLIILLPVFVVGLALLHPIFLNKFFHFLASKLKRQNFAVSISYRKILTHLCFYFSSWFLMGIAFYYLVKSLSPNVTWVNLWELTIIFCASYTIGHISVFTPGGLGIREGTMAFLLGKFLPIYLSTVIAIFARLWTLSVSILCFALSLAISRLSKVSIEDG